MKNQFTFLLLLIFSSCQSEEYLGNGQVEKLKVDTTIRLVAEEMAYFDSPKCAELEEKEKRKCADREIVSQLFNIARLPEDFDKNILKTKTLIRFVVEKDGSLTNFEILKDTQSGLGAVVIDAVKKLKKFVPAKEKGIPVRTYFHLPFRVRLE